MFDFLRRRVQFQPVRFGPDCAWRRNVLAIRTGPLSGCEFVLSSDITPFKADFTLTPAEPTADSRQPSADLVCGHCHFDRDPDTGMQTLWDIVVHPDFRRTGLAALLVRTGFRALIAYRRPCWFGMRKLMMVDTRRPELHNVGIGLVAVRLGFRPETGLDDILTGRSVKDVSILPATAESPPGLMIHLARLPGVVVAAELEPREPDRTPRPVSDAARYRRFFNPEQMLRLARQGEWLIGNVDYVLARRHIETICRHIADTPGEFGRFTGSLAAGAKKLGLHRAN